MGKDNAGTAVKQPQEHAITCGYLHDPARCLAQSKADMTVDDTVLKALEGGPVTVKDITKRFEKRVRMRLDKLRLRGIVIREGKGGAPAVHL
jgi:hypothetical protein